MPNSPRQVTPVGKASAGVISSLLFGATARQIQVAMKLSF